MSTTIIEDRVLARLARDAVGWDDGVTPAAERTEIAIGRATIALRLMGIATTPELAKALRDDIAIALAAPERPALLAA